MTSTIYDTAAALAVTAENLADAIDDDRPGWPDLAARARDLLTTLVTAKLNGATGSGAVVVGVTEWACCQCSDAYFGTPPDNGLCPSCQLAGSQSPATTIGGAR